MQELNQAEVNLVGGGDWADTAAKAGVVAAAAGAAAMIPSPATPALAFVALSTALIAVGASWVASKK